MLVSNPLYNLAITTVHAEKLKSPDLLLFQVVALVSKCGESHSEAVQLAVIRALLTITTAEHFVVHGDSLMQAVRTVFNVAIGSESVEIQRTARSALLQMLNTIVKRVTSYSLVRPQSTYHPHWCLTLIGFSPQSNYHPQPSWA